MKVTAVVAMQIATGLTMGVISLSSYASSREQVGNIQVKDLTDTIKMRDQKGADDQYDKDESNIYISKEAAERYKGTNPADILNHGVGVYSGDARNSGALDPNVRGIQGQGRVPVTIDGSEQAITVWRGYNGANNRNYIDPNMISSITVVKSPMLDRDIRTSVGGGVAVKTLSIDDVVPFDERFAIDIKLETRTNSTKPRINQLHLGTDYRDDFQLMDSFKKYDERMSLMMFRDPEVSVEPDQPGSSNFFNLKDSAMRVALGLRQDKFDLLFAYSHRNQGNYFAGRHGANYFREPIIPRDNKYSEKTLDPNIPFVANVYLPTKEVGNTSSNIETFLQKINLQLSESQKISLGYVHTKSHYGEIMPSQIRFHDLAGEIPQWPLANISLSSFYANYGFKPNDQSLLDFKLSYWLTKTDLNSNTAGGAPRQPLEEDWTIEINGKNPYMNGKLVDAIKLNQLNDRQGISLSNKSQLTPNFDITFIGNFIHERINSHEDLYAPNAEIPKRNVFRAIPREGKRQEYSGAIKLDWRPTDWLNVNAGLQYQNYWSRDLLRERRLKVKDSRFAVHRIQQAMNFEYSRPFTEEEARKVREYVDNKGRTFDGYDKVGNWHDYSIGTSRIEWFVAEALSLPKYSLKKAEHYSTIHEEYEGFRITGFDYIKWRVDEDGKLTVENNPFYNGEIDLTEEVIDPISQKKVKAIIAYRAPNKEWDYISVSENEKYKNPGKRINSAWSPSLGGSIYLSENDRVFARYAETVRMPSIFEDTIGFSGAGDSAIRTRPFKPERSHTFEIGYVRNLQSWLKAENAADFRINYYHNIIDNAFDRDGKLVFAQMDQHRTAGLEVLARYDNGRFFGDLGVDFRLKNEVCDDASMVHLDPLNKYKGSICTEGGFPNGYLRTQLQPKYSIHTNLGMRFFNESMEVGGRVRYHAKTENKDEAQMASKFGPSYAPLNNNPMSWNAVFVTDAYVTYQVNKNLLVELLASNVLNEYYIDPLTRSMMPAPGRSLRLSVTSHF
ncbi:hemoglobin/transferrin/lactoferrin receptor protein [Providencia alcalifaciens]|uniref:Hemoglobin/transferrin/lactoferrin receptor protein n=1 Tax=Providencia alcalifaciens TaxID=126385 RepID=A0A4R3NM84_9GAMM|nr:TonB-dependent receptor [Providencia alcalifaciens]TCT35627.1 hemoglobin/transferrin/lactoferrin receptor protein [Providencia alcalifaciens]